MVYDSIKKLVAYGVNTGLVEPEDEIYVTNRLLEVMELDEYEEPEEIEDDTPLEEILKDLLDEAYASGVLEDNGIASRDLFDTKLMGCLVARPSEVIRAFMDHYAKSPVEATDFFYKFSQDTDYIRRYRICRDIRWVTKSVYGDIDITINLSKPEKDPQAIAAARLAKQSSYPKCQLCKENEGYAGRLDHPARENHRIIPITINGGEWGFQYSP